MKYNCYLCNKEVRTNDIFATMSFELEQIDGDIIETIKEEKICGFCVHRFEYYLKNAIKPFIEKDENNE